MTTQVAETDHGASGEGAGHAVPLGVLAGIFVVLLGLTFLTVAATWVQLGALNIWIALGIALVKAVLVALYFMHLRYDSPFNGMVLAAALAFVILFIGITIIDSRQYAPAVEAAAPAPPLAPAPPAAPEAPLGVSEESLRK
ncbi:MAG: cytochrome C oxidase subunit IV family protein [Phycisphaeraceae bacterium]|nr:cytochrome C oxidase subunit IV family protein [Phycisphaeraceae bacterium]